MLSSASFLLPTLFLMMLYQTTSHLSSGPHIADVNILLPHKMTHPVEYRLKGSDGCFKWTWDHHDVLSVLPEYNSSSRCSTSAILKSIAPYGGRKETAVYATDLNSGMVIRCKVYIDSISRIQIFHNSIKLDLDGLTTLRVRAFDNEENVFSSLVGLQFIWQLMPEVDGLPHHLVHVPLKESPLSDCGGLCGDLDIQVKLEESGVYSDLYLVKGNEIGHEIVSVHLLEPSIQHLEDKIILTVAEAMSLDPPSPVLVLVGAIVNYNLKAIRGNSPHVVSLPSPFHQWSVLNSSVALVERKIGEVKALDIGTTKVIVEDTRVVGHMQTSSLHVVLPDSLLMFISPLSLSNELTDGTIASSSVSRWYVVSGRQYLIHVKVLSPGPGAQEIYITESDDIRLHDSDPEFLNTIPVSEAMTTKSNYRILNANSYGLGKITATLFYRSGLDTKKVVLKTVQEVMVCNQVHFIMERGNVSERILLPWIPGVNQKLELKASGGCAASSRDYKWFSSDMNAISVSASGIVRAIKPGMATIRAVSVFDSLNYDVLIVEVTFPASIIMLPDFPVETSVGTHLQASVTFKSPSGSKFYACDAFRSSVRWKTESGSFLIVNGTVDSNFSNEPETVEHQSLSYGPPCAWTLIYAANHGRTVVHAALTKENLQFDHSGTSTLVLKTSFTITAYLPLIVHQASDGNQFGGYWFDWVDAQSQNQLNSLDYLYLTPGTLVDLMLYGGPERWDQDVEYIETVEALDENNLNVGDVVIIYQMPAILGNAYKIGCIDLGTFKLVFRRGNLIGKDHSLPVVAEVWLSLMCSIPSAIVIVADEPLNKPQILQSAVQAERMPGGIRVSPITIANDRRIRVSSVGISDSGKAFANSSSLNLRWELSECEGLVLVDDDYSLSITKSSWEIFFILQNVSGACIIRSTVVGFTDSKSYIDFSGMLGSPNSLTDAIKLQLVSSLRITPAFSLLLYNLDARLNLSVTGGSCFLDVTVNNTEVVEIKQQSPVYECSHLIVAPQKLGSAVVTVHDIGLSPPLVASSTVQVADVGWIKIITGERISIVLGGMQSINILVGVGDGLTFDYSQYIYMNICVHVEEDTVELAKNYNSKLVEDGCVHAPNFTIQAMRLGVTSIYLSTVQHSGLEIRSKPVKLEVYAPPRIFPSDIFLVPGASFVLTVRGGPKFGSHVQYKSRDSQIAQVHESSGRLSAISPGNSTVVATIYGNGNIQLYQVLVIVRVGIPSSAILNVQSEHLVEGRSMQIHPSLSDGNLFSFYELCKNFKWNLEDEKILNFHEANHVQEAEHDITRAFRYTGSLNEQDYNFIQVLYGKSSGKTNVTVSFSCNFKLSGSLSKTAFFSASILLSVVPNLPLALGVPMTWILPPHYTSSDLLPLSSDRNIDENFQNDAVVISYSLVGQCKRMTVEQHDTSISIRGAKIVTKGFDNLECIQAKDESTGRTEIASCVKVAEVAQIRIMTNQLYVHMLAVDAELDLLIQYHDAFGNPFYEAHNISLFEAETDNPDVISFKTEDGTGRIRILGKSRGIALLRLWFTSSTKKSEYIVISVGPQLHPHNPVVYQGSKLDFSVKGLSDFASGQWFSANTSIVHVESLSGNAEALGGGQTFVHFKSSGLELHTKVTVLESEPVLVEAPKEILTNAPFPIKYLFSVKFRDAYMASRESIGDKTALLFDCAVDPPYIGFSKPWRNLETGSYYCLFYPYSPEHLAPSATNSGCIGHPISVCVRASLKGDHHISGSATAPFIGGFSILEMDQKSLHLNMTKNSDNSVITLIGNTDDIIINWRVKDHLSVKPVHKSGNMEGKHVQYEIKVLGSERFSDRVVFSIPATDLRAVIDVSYEPGKRKSLAEIASVTSWTGVAGIFLVLILTVTLLIYCLDIPDKSQPLVAFGTPSATALATPERTSSAVTNNKSPRSPQPFIDYVRMTLDETPYYRKDFRRRNNPQNTY